MKRDATVDNSSCSLWVLVLLVILVPASASRAGEGQDLMGPLQVQPAQIKLAHRRQPHSVLVTARATDGRLVDFTSQATFRSNDETVARTTALGWVDAVDNGSTAITVTVAGRSASVVVHVELPSQPRPASFRHDVMPVLSKAGCNAGSCHGYSLGKNGFKLSLRGSDPGFDFGTLTDEFFERRVNRHDPRASLLLTKPLGELPHKGGVRFDRGSLLHQHLLDWIRAGAPSDLADPVQLESIKVHPERATLAPGLQQQLQLIAQYSDGSTRDVTRLGIFNVNSLRVAQVTDEGLVTASDLGETAVVARFERIFATTNFIVLEPQSDFTPTPIEQGNLVDRFVVQKLNSLQIRPSDSADDATFLRRVYLDLIGIQPTPDEVAEFLADTSLEKRDRVIDRLFERPEFIDQWSLKWGDLLQISRSRLSTPAVYAFREWIRGAIASRMPLDEFVSTLLTGRGGVTDDATAAYFAISQDTDDTLQRATQVFCGVRMLCAKCHPHPFENWTQGDYYGLHSFFNQVATKADPRAAGVANAKTVVLNRANPYSLNPRTGQRQRPRFLGGGEPDIPSDADRREVYARWLTSPENPFFARSMTNRIWSYFFHRGIIDPVDDLRTTNPPINPELLQALTRDFVEHDFDVQHLMRTIVTSQTYGRSSMANATNAHDDLNFSRAIPRRLPAESLLDCLVQATGVSESFPGAPAGFTAKQLPDATLQSDFLSLFGKPQRMEACECERDDGSNMLQALHLINGKSILSRVTAKEGRVAQLLKQHGDNNQFIHYLYLWSLARPPSDAEVQLGLKFLDSYGDDRDAAAQDLMWALLNSKDFVLVH